MIKYVKLIFIPLIAVILTGCDFFDEITGGDTDTIHIYYEYIGGTYSKVQ